MEGPREDKSGWSSFPRHLMNRGLSGVQLLVPDSFRGLVESVTGSLPDTRWQRCIVHFHRNVFSRAPSGKMGGHRAVLPEPSRDFIIEQPEQVSHPGLSRLQDLLAGRGVKVCHDTVRRFLKRDGFSFKKACSPLSNRE